MAGRTPGRVVKPKNVEEGLKLAANIYKKHQEDKENSELRNLVEGNWDVTGPTIEKAQTYHDKAEQLKSQMEEQYRLRDAAYAPIQKLNDDSAAYLKGKYRSNPKKLGDWGYEIDDSAPATRSKKS